MKNCFLIFIISFAPFVLFAQSPVKIKRTGDKLFDTKEYKEALSHYDQIKELLVKDIDLKYKLGVCYFYLNQFNQSILYLDFYAKNSTQPKPKTNYYIARAHHLQNEFKKAANYYKKYLKELASTAPQRQIFKRLIVQCMNGPKLEQINSGAIVATLGDKVNGPYDEFRPCFNPQVAHTLFFSSNRAGSTGGKLDPKNKIREETEYYHTDIYRSRLIQGNWAEATSLSERYNTEMSEDIISFFDRGYQMVFLKGYSDGHKEVVKDNFDTDTVQVVLPFAIGASSNYWDGDHFFVTDSIIIFSSNRPGGYGAKDLYYATLSKNEVWSKAENLGPAINSRFDEISPFLAKNGRSLYFSSNGHQSMGGFDVFKAFFQDSSRTWTSPKNIGTPINSSADEKDFALNKDGLKAYFCSKRIGGMGGFDLYSAYFRSYLPEQLSGKEPKTFVNLLSNNDYLAKSDSKSTLNKLTPVGNNEHPATVKDQVVYNLAPIYYNAKTGKTEGSRNTIIALTKLLTKQPESVIVLSGHSDNTGNPTNDLYLSVKQVEELAKELIKNGAKNEQIWIRGCGQNYPIASNQNFDGSPNSIGGQMNRRINIDVYNINHLKGKVAVQIIEPKVSSVMANVAYAEYKEQLKGLTYKVQITETASLYTHSIFTEFEHTSTEKYPNDVNVKYMIGLESSFGGAEKISIDLSKKGFVQAKIVPYINGIKISTKDATMLVEEYEDLDNFLKFEANK
jgi:tetratricopeptide (TPR) repeat protein